MELKEAIFNRRSVRKYQDKPVPKDLLREILAGACMAPSGINLQPWYFLALTNENDREKFLKHMNESFQRFKPTLESRFANNPEVVKSTGSFLTTLGNAPVVILVFLFKKEFAEGMSPTMSVAIAMQNLMLMAHDMGLATCLVTAPVETGVADAVRAEFAPDRGALLGAITLGYPDQTPKAPPRREGRFEII